jgi:hypothetical protein
MSYQFTPDKLLKRSGSPINKINIKRNKKDLLNIFTSNKIKYNFKNYKQSLEYINYCNNIPFNIFNNYCYNNEISNNIITFSINMCYTTNVLLNSYEYENLTWPQKECILIASLVCYLKIFHNKNNILDSFNLNEDKLIIINEIIEYITLNNSIKEIDSWKLIPKYVLITMKIGEYDLHEMCNLPENNRVEYIKNYKETINQFKYNFKNEYLYNLFLLRLNQFNNFYNYIENMVSFDEEQINNFYNY